MRRRPGPHPRVEGGGGDPSPCARFPLETTGECVIFIPPPCAGPTDFSQLTGTGKVSDVVVDEKSSFSRVFFSFVELENFGLWCTQNRYRNDIWRGLTFAQPAREAKPDRQIDSSFTKHGTEQFAYTKVILEYL